MQGVQELDDANVEEQLEVIPNHAIPNHEIQNAFEVAEEIEDICDNSCSLLRRVF